MKSTLYLVLKQVAKRTVMHFLDGDITFGELKKAVTNLKTHKALGLNKVPREAFKWMDEECLQHVLKYLNDFLNQQAGFKSWHRSQLICVPKSGNLSDPNKWRGIMLLDVMSKRVSCIMNARAFKILDKHGTEFQFGSTPRLGCADGLFTLNTALSLRMNHNLPTFT